MTKLGRKVQPEEPEAIANLIVNEFRGSREAPDVYNGIWSIQLGGVEIWIDLSKAYIYPDTTATLVSPVAIWGNEHVMSQETFEGLQEQWFIKAKEYGMEWGLKPVGNWDVFKQAWNTYLLSMGVTWDDWQIEMAIKLEQETLEDQQRAED